MADEQVLTVVAHTYDSAEALIQAAERMGVPYMLSKSEVAVRDLPDGVRRYGVGIPKDARCWVWTITVKAHTRNREDVILGGTAFLERPQLHTFRLEPGGEIE